MNETMKGIVWEKISRKHGIFQIKEMNSTDDVILCYHANSRNETSQVSTQLYTKINDQSSHMSTLL